MYSRCSSFTRKYSKHNPNTMLPNLEIAYIVFLGVFLKSTVPQINRTKQANASGAPKNKLAESPPGSTIQSKKWIKWNLKYSNSKSVESQYLAQQYWKMPNQFDWVAPRIAHGPPWLGGLINGVNHPTLLLSAQPRCCVNQAKNAHAGRHVIWCTTQHHACPQKLGTVFSGKTTKTCNVPWSSRLSCFFVRSMECLWWWHAGHLVPGQPQQFITQSKAEEPKGERTQNTWW